MPIPKVIYQTWKTKVLHPLVQGVRDKIQALNPNYVMILYDDDDMDNFVRENFPGRIYKCYRKLWVGAGRADLWRYCILYKLGGVYLDMDSAILRSLDELIESGDQAIVTREGNPGIFNNWILMFEAGHPILWRAIEKCCYNIENRVSNNICDITGPQGPWTAAINDILLPIYRKPQVHHLYYESDEALNAALNSAAAPVRCKFHGVDMGNFACWKHDFKEYLYQNHTHWSREPRIFVDEI